MFDRNKDCYKKVRLLPSLKDIVCHTSWYEKCVSSLNLKTCSERVFILYHIEYDMNC